MSTKEEKRRQKRFKTSTYGQDQGATKVSLDSLPDEILEHHIFAHYKFNYWLARFAPVCKRWMRICEHSKIYPKQLEFHGCTKIGMIILRIRKCQPSIVSLQHWFALREPKLLTCLGHIVRASKYLDTLIFGSRFYEGKEFLYTAKELDQITTLVMPVEVDVDRILQIFPKVTRLRINSQVDKEKMYVLALQHGYNLQTLVLDRSQSPYSEVDVPLIQLLGIPDATIIHQDYTIIINKGKIIKEKTINYYSYGEYFNIFGKSKLTDALDQKDYNVALDMLKTETTAEYEQNVYNEACFTTYKFPNVPSGFMKQYSDVISNGYKVTSKLYEMFIEAKLLWLDDYMEFNSLVEMKQISSALKLLPCIDSKHYSKVSIIEFLLSDLLDETALHDKEILEIIVRILTVQFGTETDYPMPYEAFQKISFAKDIDWFLINADTENAKGFKEMVDKGCRFDPTYVSSKWRDPSFNNIEDELESKDKRDMIYMCQVLDLNFKQGRALAKQKNLEPTVERRGKSLFNYWISIISSLHNRSDDDNKWERRDSEDYDSVEVQLRRLKRYKKYINHIDSSGYSPLTTAIVERLPYEAIQELLLGFGAHPSFHRSDKLTPLALVIKDYYKNAHDNYRVSLYEVITLLVGCGADVNEQCLFKGKLCSPLMIAIKYRAKMRVIRFLIGIGARVDDRNENGKSAWEKIQKKYDEKKVKSLKYLLRR